MQQFTVKPGSFKEVQNKIVKTLAFLFGGVLFFVVGFPMMTSNGFGSYDTLPYMIVLFGGVSVFSIWNSMKKQKVLFESFKLIIDDEKITRERLNMPVIVIYKKDVQRITKTSSGTFWIEGNSKLNAIGIPAQIDHYELLEKTLSEIKPLTVRTKKTFLEHMILPSVLIVALLFWGHFYITNTMVSIGCGILLVLIFASSFVVSITNKNIDTRTKRASYLSLIFAAVVIFNVYTKLVG